MWVHAGEYADLERLAHLIRKLLKTFRPNDVWSLTYAAYCSKPHVGEFGGGGFIVTATQIKWNNAHNFVEEEAKTFHERNSEPQPVQTSRD